jgi:hypothetical protein
MGIALMTHSSPITNCWGNAETTVVPTEEYLIFKGREGSAYNHHHQITSLNGRLYATWSTADVHEDSSGQHMMMATSDDLGTTWSSTRPLVDRVPGEFGEAVVTSLGIRVYNGRMVAYWGHYDYTEQAHRLLLEQATGLNGKADLSVRWHQNVFTGIKVSDDAGESWSDAGRIDRFIANLSPHEMADGRLVIPGQMWHPWTDDPYGIEGWTVASIPRLDDDFVDCTQGFWYAKTSRGDDFTCCEGSCYQTDDGVIHMMLRTETDRLAVTESYDNGISYSEPMITDFTDCHCRFQFGCLPDGRYFATSCPDPGSHRTPLVVAISEDGVRFDRHFVVGSEPNHPPRADGIQKFGRYGYPSYHIMDGILFVIFSIGKEDIAMKRVPLSVLS